MSRRPAAAALATPPDSTLDLDIERLAQSHRPVPRGSDRREYARLTPAELSARFKYGEAVKLVDVSAGGALLETTRILKPDTDLVLEILDARTSKVAHVISRVLRSQVAGIDGVIRYRGACRFKRPLSHPTLVAQPAPLLLPTDPSDFLKLEFALKTIVEGYFRRPRASREAGRWRDGSALLDALVRLRAAAERRRDPNNGQLAALLDNIIPALQQRRAPEAIIRDLQGLLARQLPLLTIRANGRPDATSCDREVVTFSIAAEAGEPRIAVTAEFAAGFALDEGQFRLLKAGAYLVSLVKRWRMPVDEQEAVAAESNAPPPPESALVVPHEDAAPISSGDDSLPAGWNRIVVRYIDGQLLRGYTNDFHPERAHLHLSPHPNCQANERLLVPFPRLKAVFFVKSLEGNPQRVDDQTFDGPAGARKVEVSFRDGEVMRGSAANYKPNAKGYFLQPPNGRGNNIRVYVMSAAVRQLRFV